MRNALLSVVSTLLVVLLGCGIESQTGESPIQIEETPVSVQEPEERADVVLHPAVVAANTVLIAIRNRDMDAIKPLMNENNRDISDDQFDGLFTESQEKIGDATEISEIRQGSRPGYVNAKIRDSGDEVFVVVLTLEDGQYFFEDINSPAKDDYEQLKLIE